MTSIKTLINPLVTGQLHQWQGLPILQIADLEKCLGECVEEKTTTLGAFDAQSYRFNYPDKQHKFIAYTRGGDVLMLEASVSIDIKAMGDLEETSAILPEEIFVEGFYSHEYLYVSRGLLLTVVQPLGETMLSKIIRCRGIRVLSSAEELGPELYQALEYKVKW